MAEYTHQILPPGGRLLHPPVQAAVAILQAIPEDFFFGDGAHIFLGEQFGVLRGRAAAEKPPDQLQNGIRKDIEKKIPHDELLSPGWAHYLTFSYLSNGAKSPYPKYKKAGKDFSFPAWGYIKLRNPL